MTSVDAPIRVVIVDDHASFTQALTLYFDRRASDITVEGVAHTAADGVNTTLAVRPHVVVMDLLLPDGNGIDAALEIRRKLRSTRVLIVTSEDDIATMNQALKAGIQGYLVKRVDADAIAQAVRAIHRGDLVFDGRARDTIVELAAVSELNEKEIHVLRLVAEGCKNERIAAEMTMSLASVKRVLQSTFAKLGAVNRASAVAEAKRQRLI